MENPQILRILSKDDLHLEELGIGVNGDKHTRTALFCIIPDSDKSYNFIVGMLYTQLFQELYFQADFKNDGKLPIQVTLMMDEFANVALPDDFCSLLSTMRSRRISSIIIIQNLAQIKALFKDTWETITGNCDTLVYLGGNEKSTHQYISEMLGKSTIDKRSTGETKRLFEDMLHGATSLHPKFCFTNSKAYFLLRDNDVRTFYSIDIPTMELQEVRRWSTEILAWSVYDNTLYYYASERGTFCEYDLTTGAEKTFSQLDYFGGAAYYDDTYIYLITWNDDDGNGKGLSIFSRDYQLLERIEFSANQDLLYDAQDKLIFTDLPSQKATKYLPKSAIGTGEAELLPIEDPYSYR